MAIDIDYVRIARACHNVNRAMCRALGDDGQRPFDEADQWQRKSAMVGVHHVIDHPDVTAAGLHEAWCEYKRGAGWTCGPAYDPEKKEHPRLVPYEQLSPEQRMKGHVFLAVVRELAGG